MERKKLSVIIPCYNGFKYMEKCLEAFENQSSKNFELIIVDDASSDDSFNRLMEYKEKSDLQMTIIHNDKNYGPGKSRSIARDYCNGQYVGFCDCDDWLDTSYVEEVTDRLSEKDSDLCMFNNYRVNGENLTIDDVTSKLLNARNRMEILAYASMSLCRIVVSKELLDQVMFYDLYYGEDGIVLLQLLMKAKNPIFCKKPYYFYLMRNSSAHSRPSKRCFSDALEGYSILKEIMKEKYRDELVFTGIKNLIYAGTLQAFKANINMKEIMETVENFKKENPVYISNKYLSSLNKVKRVYVKLIYYRYFHICRIMAFFHNYLMGK